MDSAGRNIRRAVDPKAKIPPGGKRARESHASLETIGVASPRRGQRGPKNRDEESTPMKKSLIAEHAIQPATKAHSAPSWSRNMSASGKGHRRHPAGGVAGKPRSILARGGSRHLG